MMRRVSAIVAIASIVGSALAFAPEAQADDVDRNNAALALFNAAETLAGAGKWAEACPKYEEVLRLQPKAIATQFKLADCYDHIGKVASAWTTYNLAAAAAANAGQDDRVTYAREKADALKPKVPDLTLEVPEPVAKLDGLTVERDHVLIGKAQFGLALPIDPGTHSIVVSAPGRKSQTVTVQIEVGMTGKKIALPMLEVDPNAKAGLDGKTSGKEGPVVPVDDGPPAWAWTVGALGVVSAGVAVGFAVDGATATCDVDAAGKCDANIYTGPDIESLNDRRHRDLPLALTFGGVGVALVVVGIVGLTADSDDAEAEPTVSVLPWLDQSGGGLWMGGQL